jgi:hypothetical protein
MYRKCLPRDRFSLPLVLKSGAGCVRKPPQLLGPHTVEELSQMKSQLPHRQASRQPYTRLGKQLLGLIAAVAVRKKWFKDVRRLIGSTWESFSQPHSVPHHPKTGKSDASLSRSHRCYITKGTDVVFECTPDGESPSFTCQSGAVTLIARSAVYNMRLCTWETHSCPTVPTSPLDKAWT